MIPRITALVLLALLPALAYPQTAGKKQTQPRWVAAPAEYYGGGCIAAAGYGPDRAAAEKNAVAALARYFSVSVTADTQTALSYSESAQNGAVSVTATNTLNETVSTQTSIENIAGAEIRDVWFDGKQTWHAAAVMDKAKTAAYYSSLAAASLASIEQLTAVPPQDRYTFDALIRCRRAAAIADESRIYAAILSLVSRTPPPAAPSAAQLRLEADDIQQHIVIEINAAGADAAAGAGSRIASAFQNVLTKQSFKTTLAKPGAPAARYELAVRAVFAEDPVPNPRFKFVNWTLEAQLTDRANGSVLLPFSLSGKEGHTTLDAARLRCVESAEKQIHSQYPPAFQSWFDSLPGLNGP